ncbi:hypothetical protein [Bradyrhizobium sp. Ash2021]
MYTTGAQSVVERAD